MKILAVCSNFHVPVGGIKQVVKRVGEELVKRHHEYTVLTINAGNSKNEDWDNGIHIIRLPYSRFNVIGDRESLNIISYLQRNLGRFDIVNIYSYYSVWSLITSFVCKRKSFPCVFTPDYHVRGTKKGIYPLVYDLYSLVGRLSFKWVDKIVCVSEYEKNLLKSKVSVPDSKIAVIPNGVDQVISHNKKTSRDAVVSILYVGVLFEAKGVQYTIKALSVLKKRYNRECRFDIVGDGPYRTTLENLVRDLDLEDSVNFCGIMTGENLLRKFEEASVFVLLSRSETYGIVVAEALAMGTPCIVANIDALQEFTKEPGCFSVGYPPDANEVANLIIKIYDNEIKVGPFSKKIRTWDKVAVHYEKLYEQILNLYEVREQNK